MAPRQKTITMVPDASEPAQEVLGQGKRPDKGQFRLEVDRQTKATYGTYEKAGLAIKQGRPILQVAVYDTIGGVNKIIELPKN